MPEPGPEPQGRGDLRRPADVPRRPDRALAQPRDHRGDWDRVGGRGQRGARDRSPVSPAAPTTTSASTGAAGHTITVTKGSHRGLDDPARPAARASARSRRPSRPSARRRRERGRSPSTAPTTSLIVCEDVAAGGSFSVTVPGGFTTGVSVPIGDVPGGAVYSVRELAARGGAVVCLPVPGHGHRRPAADSGDRYQHVREHAGEPAAADVRESEPDAYTDAHSEPDAYTDALSGPDAYTDALSGPTPTPTPSPEPTPVPLPNPGPVQPTVPDGAPDPPPGPDLVVAPARAAGGRHRRDVRRSRRACSYSAGPSMPSRGFAMPAPCPRPGSSPASCPQYVGRAAARVARIVSVSASAGRCSTTQARALRARHAPPGQTVVIRTRARPLVTGALHSVVFASSATPESNTTNNQAGIVMLVRHPVSPLRVLVQAPPSASAPQAARARTRARPARPMVGHGAGAAQRPASSRATARSRRVPRRPA